MKKPVTDYTKFKLSKINDPEFSHLKLLWGWVLYFAMYVITENFIPENKCYIIHHKLDDLIPFCEVFVIPYVLWYVYVAGSLFYFVLYNTKSFKKLMTFIILTQFIAMAVYIIFPNRQDLRPEVFPRNNVFTYIVNLLYTVDTDTNVCPSLHVGYSIAVASVWLKEKGISALWKLLSTLFAALVCISTAFIKQHSVVDIWWAMVMCAFIEIIVYGKYWTGKIKKQAEPAPTSRA